MGKKSKAKRRAGGGGKKKATAASNTAVSTRTEAQSVLTSASQGNLTAVATPRKSTLPALPSSSPSVLRGIISSNDDPGKCAACSKCMPLESDDYILAECCGKHFCKECVERGRYHDLLGDARCAFCSVALVERRAAGKRMAHLGKAWAQYRYAELASSNFRWLQKAAEQSHPLACLNLAELFLDGEHGVRRDVRQDLEIAKSYAEKAKSLYTGFADVANEYLLDVVENYFKEGMVEDAMAILADFVNIPDTNAVDSIPCERAAGFLFEMEQYHLSGNFRAISFYQGAVESALMASMCFELSKKYALCKLWFSVACQTKCDYVYVEPMDDGSSKKRSWSDVKICREIIQSKLRKARNSCGGCGAALEGAMRKYCRGCKAYCYCSKDCQKLHWNRKKDSHRDECKEAKEHWEKVMEAIRSGKVILSKEKE